MRQLKNHLTNRLIKDLRHDVTRSCIVVSFLHGLLIITSSKAHAQLFQKPIVAAQAHYGSLLANIPKVVYVRDSYTRFGEIALLQRTDGSKPWHARNGYPLTGIALLFGHTGSHQYIGNMAAAYPFVLWNISRQNRFSSSLRAGAGLGWIEKPYNKISNHKNTIIGTHLNAFLQLSWQNKFQLSQHIALQAGATFSHFSNGSIKLPNLGLNAMTIQAGLQYGVWKKFEQKQIAQTRKTSTVAAFTSVGVKQYPWVESKRYVVNVLQTEWMRSTHRNNHYGAGLLFLYDRALVVNPAGIADHLRKGNELQAGVYAAYEHQFGRLSIPLHVGAYVYNRDIHPALFQQLGFRYSINAKWSTQLAMKTHMGKADFIFAGIGYKFQ